MLAIPSTKLKDGDALTDSIQTLRKVIKVANARAQCQLNTTQLAARAHITRKVVYKAEHGRPISRISAYAMLKVLNPIREDVGLPPLDIDDLDWVIQGEGKRE